MTVSKEDDEKRKLAAKGSSNWWGKIADEHMLDALLKIPKKKKEIIEVKPREKKPETVFRIIDRESGEATGSYSRAYCDEYDFHSAEEARNANCHGVFKDEEKYKIAKYKVTYELIEEDV